MDFVSIHMIVFIYIRMYIYVFIYVYIYMYTLLAPLKRQILLLWQRAYALDVVLWNHVDLADLDIGALAARKHDCKIVARFVHRSRKLDLAIISLTTSCVYENNLQQILRVVVSRLVLFFIYIYIYIHIIYRCGTLSGAKL